MGYAVKCFLIKDNKALLVKQIKDTDDLWIFPGGKLEDDESPDDCVHREMKKELGIDVEIIKRLGEIDNVWQGRRDLLYCFVCQVMEGEISIRKEEIREAKWFLIDQLPALGPTSDRIFKLWLREQAQEL
jgi:8-oxo-dGTP diphosphatase